MHSRYMCTTHCILYSHVMLCGNTLQFLVWVSVTPHDPPPPPLSGWSRSQGCHGAVWRCGGAGRQGAHGSARPSRTEGCGRSIWPARATRTQGRHRSCREWRGETHSIAFLLHGIMMMRNKYRIIIIVAYCTATTLSLLRIYNVTIALFSFHVCTSKLP